MTLLKNRLKLEIETISYAWLFDRSLKNYVQFYLWADTAATESKSSQLKDRSQSTVPSSIQIVLL